MIFGKTGFKLVSSGVTLFDDRQYSVKDLSDIQSEYTVFVAGNGARNYTVTGQRIFPVLKFLQITAAEWVKIKGLLNQTVTFTPFSDNPAWSFDCKVTEITPIWQDGKYWKNTAMVKLKSVGYPEIITKPTLFNAQFSNNGTNLIIAKYCNNGTDLINVKANA